MESRKAFSIALKQIRKEQRLTQEELAEKSSLSVRYISLLENNTKQATITTLDVLAKALCIKKCELIQRAEQIEESAKTK